MYLFIFRTLCALFLTLAYTLTFAQQPQQRLPTKQFKVGNHVIQAEVASTEAQLQLGLMNRRTLGEDEGMLFVFDRELNYCMWMKNTLIPLAVAFLDSTGVIVNIEEMRPQTEKEHCASKPALYALEMNAHWFKRKNIHPGDKVDISKLKK